MHFCLGTLVQLMALMGPPPPPFFAGKYLVRASTKVGIEKLTESFRQNPNTKPEPSLLLVVPGQCNKRGEEITSPSDIDDETLLLDLKCVTACGFGFKGCRPVPCPCCCMLVLCKAYSCFYTS